MAEICLITGTPGSGKTLKMVSMMANDEMFQPDENGMRRKVFTNIKGLKIPHIYIETDAKKLPKSTDEQLSAHDMYEWIEKPENIGSIVIVDEAQDVWPVRSAGSKIPDNVQWLNTHRHQGIDIFVLTQGPKLLDQTLRTLVRKHYHIASNKMGMRTLLEFNSCADDPLKMVSNGFSSIYTLDKKVYDLYESAEVHTVNKVKRSKWFYTLPVIILLIPVFVGLSYKMLSSYGKKQEETASKEESASELKDNSASSANIETVQSSNGNLTPEMFVPVLPEKPESKPIYNGVRQVKTFEHIAGCIEGGKTGCTCYSQQGTPLKEITKEMCKDYARNGLPFDPYKEENQQNVEQKETAMKDDKPKVVSMGGKPQQNLMYDNWEERGKPFEGIGGGVVN
ncbi:zonular occludens toxin family protein [Neisseria sp. RH3002v2f]|uniref:zonular occludens toxin family protein n=1 Tax=Neisseria sp. RH3002v2f TaxID=1871108 RepID=UPI0016606103|nr:zonular occludens toxin domain-containing protein [Neisseria sp. RH3002v2f]MBD0764166.1 hypothetical protein [Neisseria sp. RH3002v2f]MBD0764370.1 hypothetical protein [Neisseria sp. RH3002v2f]